MNTKSSLTDAQIRRALGRRAGVAVPDDLRRLVMTGIAAQPQRWSWQARAASALSGGGRGRMLPALVAIALLVATMMAIALVGGPEPVSLGMGRPIAYISGGDLYVVGPQGESPRRVWDSPAEESLSKPTWVDAETILVNVRGTSDGASLVDLVNIATGAARVVDYGSELLALSPDHRRIATGRFIAGAGARLQIVDLATGSVIDLAGIESVAPLSWSPDGRWLIGEGSRSGNSGFIYRIDLQADLASGRFSDLATGLCCGLHIPRPVLSPDGSRVAFVNYHQAVIGELCAFRCGTLWSLDPATGARSQLTAEEGSEEGPAFSPDGLWIAFMERDGSGTDVAVVRADGTDRRTLTETGDAYAPSANGAPYRYLYWDPDGSGLTFMKGPAAAQEHELWHVTLDGQLAQRIGAFVVSDFSR
jgi:hypothetical protein